MFGLGKSRVADYFLSNFVFKIVFFLCCNGFSFCLMHITCKISEKGVNVRV